MQQKSDAIEGLKDYYVSAIIGRKKIVYVGKRSGERFYVSFVKHHGDDFIFIGDGMSNREALAFERLHIRKLRPEDNIHHNVYRGKFAPSTAIPRLIKGRSSHELREEFAHLMRMPSLWSRSTFYSAAGPVSQEVIDAYIERQSRS